jgi:hypothetical protein
MHVAKPHSSPSVVFLYQHSLQAESKTDLDTEWNTVKIPDCKEVQENGNLNCNIDKDNFKTWQHSYRTLAILIT